MKTNIKSPKMVWWTGIVEDIIDPAQAGRVKVRIFGYHTHDKTVLPTKDLPLATPINPVTSAGMNGIMENHSLTCGTTVVGFFADGDDGQIPMIMGTIAGKPYERKFTGEGFEDPNGNWPREADSPKGYAGVGEPDVSRLARDNAEDSYSLKNRRSNRETKIRTAKAPSVQTDKILDDKSGIDYEGATWDEPHPRGNPTDNDPSGDFTPSYWDPMSGGPPKGDETSLHPLNIVNETRAGIVHERDNTPKNIRIHEYHPANTWYEIHHDGSKMENIANHNYKTIAGNENVLIRGNCNVTIAGDAKLLIQGNKYEEIEKDYFLSVIGDRITKINGNDIRVIGTDVTESIKGNRTVRVAKDDTQTIVMNQTESVGGTKRETVNGPVKENFGDFHATQIKKYRYQDVVDSMMTKVGVNFKVGAGGISEIGSAGNMTIKTLASQIVDVAVDVTETVGGNVSETISGDQTQAITGNLDIDAAQIDLN